MKKILRSLCIIVAILVLGIAGIYVYRYAVEAIHDDEIITSMEELGMYITDELNEGHDSSKVYLKYISESDLIEINEQLDGFFGSVSTYRVLFRYDEYFCKVELNYEVSDNYYVYRAYKYGEDISTASSYAQELYNVVNDIIANNINLTMSDYEKEMIIHDYIVKNCVYDFLDGELEPYSYKAYGALVKNTAVCNGYAEAMELLLMCVNVDSYIVVGEADGVAHAWNLVELENNWYHIDATWDDPVPDRGDTVSHAYANLNDEIMSYNHTWNKKAYPESISLDYNYYILNSGIYNCFPDYKNYVLGVLDKESPDTISVMVEGYDENIYDFNFIFKCDKVTYVTYTIDKIGKYTVIELILKY